MELSKVSESSLDLTDESFVGNESLPPLLRNPEPVSDPVPVQKLRAARRHLLANSRSTLDDEAASTITAGAVDPVVLEALSREVGEGATTLNLLMPKPVAGGTLYALPPHSRYLDLDVLPDFLNQRWGHLLHTAMDTEPSSIPAATYETLGSDEAGEHRAIFKVRMKDRATLAEVVKQSMRMTHEVHKDGQNDYTTSVLQQGVKEPLTLFAVRVVYDDGDWDTYLVTGDGNSRLVSMWRARVGGDIDAAAAACVDTVIGPVERSGQRRAADQRAARRRVEAMATRVRRGLSEAVLTESTRREGHTLTFPAIVIVGAQADDGSPMADLVSARDDVLANLHVHVTPWVAGAQYAQGMHRVYRHAVEAGLITSDEHTVLLGAVGPKEMNQLLGLPPHRLWSAALHQHTVLADTRAYEMNWLIRQEFSMGKADRQRVGERLGVAALSAYRSQGTVEPALRAFANGGTITDFVWKKPWHLTCGTNPRTVLDNVLERALRGEANAIAELTVLGGTAAMIEGYLSRDRGSKEGTIREDGKAPYRATPPALLAKLVATAGGLKMLHSIATAHVAADPAVLPKLFHTAERELEGETVHDGDPIMDQAGAQVTLDYEWDLVHAADPVLAEQSILENKAAKLKPGEDKSNGGEPEEVKLRRRLDQGVTDAAKAALSLARMVQKGRGREVFGSPDTVDQLRQRIKKIDEVLLQYGPIRTEVLSLEDEDGEE